MSENCPDCGKELGEVPRHSTYLNDEQYASIKAGDWYCIYCKSDRSVTGFKYFWDKDLDNDRT